MQIKIALSGATGKTGSAIVRKVAELQERFKISAEFSTRNEIKDLEAFCEGADVIIDFSAPVILPKLLKYCLLYKKPLVIGTTGLNEEHMEYLHRASKILPIVYSANMSLGANLIAALSTKCAVALANYDTEIVEYHHRYKKDAPSGTAIMLLKEIAKAKNLNYEESVILARNSNGERKPNEIGVSVVRAGGIKGEHEVIFASDNEIIKLTHQVLSRDAYADGALKAAEWILGRKPNLYSMKDLTSSNW